MNTGVLLYVQNIKAHIAVSADDMRNITTNTKVKRNANNMSEIKLLTSMMISSPDFKTVHLKIFLNMRTKLTMVD